MNPQTLRLFRVLAGFLAAAILVMAQAPTGGIRGIVSDATGAAIPGAAVRLENKQAGLARSTNADATGEYVFAALMPGQYEVRATAPGFREMARQAELLVGRELTVSFQLEVGSEAQIIYVEGDAVQVNLVDHKVEGIIAREQIEHLPLNGRNALELARLQPGVIVSSGVPSGKNNFVSVGLGGETHRGTRITVDGGGVNDAVGGGSQQNFSQEVVQEFQIAVGNADPASGISAVGTVNIVTRSGNNAFHGTAFIYGRDNSFAANPALSRDVLNPRPQFDREQFGYLASGPLVRDRLFWLTSIDRTRQRGVSVLNANNVDLLGFNTIKKEPFDVLLQTHKLDYNVNLNHRLGFRYSRDGNQGRAGGGLAENQRLNQNTADQYLLSWNAVVSPRLVNDYRIHFNKYTNYYKPTPEAIATGFPSISIRQSNVRFGPDDNSPQSTLLGRIEMMNNVSQQRGKHSLKYGGSFERHEGRGTWQYHYPARVSLYSPQEARAVGISVPREYRTINDLLQLPLAGFTFGVGNPEQPPFRPDKAAVNHRARFYFGTGWRLTPKFTLNLALAYSFEDNLVSHDLPKPRSLSKLLNGNIQPTRRDWNNLSPMFGFAWSPTQGDKTVIRGGWGLYYSTLLTNVRLVERTHLAPAGVGYFGLSQAQVPNPLNPRETLDVVVRGPTNFRGADLVRFLPAIRAPFEELSARNQKNEDLSFTNLDNTRTASALLDPFMTTPYSMHYTLGMQRELPGGVLVSVDGEFKQSVHQIFAADYNKFRHVRGVVDPYFTAVAFYQTGATAQYKALLVRAEKRYARRYQFLVSYARSSFVSMNSDGLFLGSGVSDNDNWKDSFGPQGGDRPHRLVSAATVDLPKGFQVSFITEMTSRGPNSLSAGNFDYNGDGTRGDRLPGIKNNQVNRSIKEKDIPALVDKFNAEWAGKRDAQGALVRAVSLPATFWMGDASFSQDLRLTKTFRFGERFRLVGIGEVFNVFNIANLGGFSGDLTSTRFGQPTSRISNVFGTGGPRAFQFALRFNY